MHDYRILSWFFDVVLYAIDKAVSTQRTGGLGFKLGVQRPRKDLIMELQVGWEVEVTLNPDGDIDGIPTWGPLDNPALEVVPSDDGKSALLYAVSGGATVAVQATGDVDLGDGVENLSESLTVSTVQKTTTLGLVAGVPRKRE